MSSITMQITEPSINGITIYSKSGCINCNKAKNLLIQRGIFFVSVDCDEYLLEQKEIFLSFIKSKTNIDCKRFPMIFNAGVFIGDYNQMENFINKEKEVSFDDNDFI